LLACRRIQLAFNEYLPRFRKVVSGRNNRKVAHIGRELPVNADREQAGGAKGQPKKASEHLRDLFLRKAAGNRAVSAGNSCAFVYFSTKGFL